MRVIGRLVMTLAIALPFSFAVAAGVAHGDANTGSGPAVIKCMHWKDSMNIAPGIEDAAGNQNVAAHGKLYGCNKAGGGAQFTGTFQMSGATCSNLAMSGVGEFDWANGQHSTAFLAFHPQATEPKKQFVSGSVTSGAFQGLIVSAWVRFTEVFNGSGVNCSGGNRLEQIRFSNTQSYQLLTPNIDTTTSSPTGTTTPNSTPQTVPETNPGTVPVTNHPTTPTSPVTVIIQRRPVVVVVRHFPNGTLAFTGSSGVAALVALEALLIGAALVLLDPERKTRRASHTGRRRSKSFLKVTIPK